MLFDFSRTGRYGLRGQPSFVTSHETRLYEAEHLLDARDHV